MTEMQTKVAVIGAGHAGIEAALASARLGVPTVLFTMNLDAVANLPCNPSIGGTAKGHLVFEIDALGGEMGRAADAVTLQSRTLNLGKGAAVHSKRVQADRNRYRAVMKATLEKQEGLRLVQAEITEILTEEHDGRTHVTGVRTSLGDVFAAERVILAVGTYPRAEIFVGEHVFSSGPDGMLPSVGLSDSLRSLGMELMRLKTGTPARLLGRSIDLSRLERQDGEEDAVPFSRDTDPVLQRANETMPCYVVYTNERTHELIRDNLTRSAMYSGNITGEGPRYCPSIETKLVRFPDKERHQLFLEPCGADTDEMYLGGFSTSMPTDVQRKMIHSLEGFENAQIMRYAYAIEYDCAEPTQMLPTLEFKRIGGLYGAGQFNGTSGYEEAAAQGLVAGINAALATLGREPLVLPRSSSYIGTLIDDLVTKGTREPYRMMTSRSEYRLLLRQDNADARLTPYGRQIGLIGDDRYEHFQKKQEAIEREIARIERTNVAPTEKVNAHLAALGSTPLKTGCKLAELLRRPELNLTLLAPIDPTACEGSSDREIRTCAEIRIKYDGYIRRELCEVERQRKLEELTLPEDIDYTAIRGLRLESAEKLDRIRPLNIAQASRISGVNPADISVLLIYLKSKK